MAVHLLKCLYECGLFRNKNNLQEVQWKSCVQFLESKQNGNSWIYYNNLELNWHLPHIYTEYNNLNIGGILKNIIPILPRSNLDIYDF